MTKKLIGIIGAGAIGIGIARVCSMAGLLVSMIDVSQATVDREIAALTASLERLVKRDKLCGRHESGCSAGKRQGRL